MRQHTRWQPMCQLDVTRLHMCIIRCSCCERAIQAVWGEHETQGGEVIRCWYGEDGKAYALTDFNEYIELNKSLPIDTSPEALAAGKNLREIVSPIFVESGEDPHPDDDDDEPDGPIGPLAGMTWGTVH